MNIAAIDPGVSTGIVIGSFTDHPDYVKVFRTRIDTVSNPILAVSLLRTSKCRLVVMEDKPAHPSKEGLDNWETIFQRLLGTYDYKLGKGLRHEYYKYKTLFLCKSALWKPFMKSRKYIAQAGQTPHEKDAMLLLHYFLQINYPTKEIFYA